MPRNARKKRAEKKENYVQNKLDVLAKRKEYYSKNQAEIKAKSKALYDACPEGKICRYSPCGSTIYTVSWYPRIPGILGRYQTVPEYSPCVSTIYPVSWYPRIPGILGRYQKVPEYSPCGSTIYPVSWYPRIPGILGRYQTVPGYSPVSPPYTLCLGILGYPGYSDDTRQSRDIPPVSIYVCNNGNS